jgi:hypothetical protein
MHPTQHSTIKPPFPRAADRSTLNPTVQQQRISELVKASAETLFSKGTRKPVMLRVLQTSTGEAA